MQPGPGDTKAQAKEPALLGRRCHQAGSKESEEEASFCHLQVMFVSAKNQLKPCKQLSETKRGYLGTEGCLQDNSPQLLFIHKTADNHLVKMICYRDFLLKPIIKANSIT